jgi:hypothetical protein
MRLSPTETTIENGEVVISARVTFDRPLLNKPDRLWFAFPEKFAPSVTRRSDAFAAGLIVLAMHSGEDMHIEGELSPRLARGLAEYQRVFRSWYPDKLSTIQINAACVSELPPEQAGKETLTLFSGGVDSAFTLMKHLPEHQPLTDHQVRYALFIHGYDIPLQNRSSYEHACRTFSSELAGSGVELIPVRTNLRYFTSGLLPWMIAHGCATIAAGLTLDRLCSSLLVPATHFLDDFKPWGSSPLVDHWLSTETLETLHHGVTSSRMDKVSAIAGWQPAQRFLRVCINEDLRDGVHNCSVCEKCFRTMIMLEMCGKLDQFQTFNRKIHAWDVAAWVPHYATSVVYTPSMRAYAKQTGQYEFLLPIAIAHLRGLTMFIVRKLMPQWLFQYLKKQKFPYARDPFNPVHLGNDRLGLQ